MLSALARPSIKADVTWNSVDSRWFAEVGGFRSDAGPVVVPEAALSIATVYRAVNVLAHSVASIPLVIYRRLDDGGKERAREHPQYDLLHDQPNRWMTSFRYRHLLMAQAILWGNHYAELLPGPGALGQIAPLNPDTTRVVDQMGDGRLLYVTQDVNARGLGPERRLVQDEVFHVRGFSIDGKSGLPLSRVARNAMGLALAAERHGSMFLRNGAQYSGLLTSEKYIDPKKAKELEDAWAATRGGARGSGRMPVLGGLKFQATSQDNRASQWTEARTFQVEELLRFLGVPGVLVGYTDKTATHASAEQFFLHYVLHSVRPWTENIASELNFSVVTNSPNYFADFVLEGLLKGDIKTRYTAHQLAILSGWKTRNEVRVEENYNRGPEALDEFMEPMNMGIAGEDPAEPAPPAARSPGPRRDPAEAARATRLGAIAHRAVERLVHREVVAVAGTGDRLGTAARYADDPEGWQGWLRNFYTQHADHLVRDLGVSGEAADRYCAAQCRRLAVLPQADGEFEQESIAALTRLVPDLSKEIAA